MYTHMDTQQTNITEDPQGEIKKNIKAYLKSTGKDYDWLASVCGISRNTINNYLAKKQIPESKLEIIKNILNGIEVDAVDETASADEDKPKRRRRTREQIRKDEEAEKEAAQAYQAEFGFRDMEEEDAKWAETCKQAVEEARKELQQAREDVRYMRNFDMTNPDNAECVYEGAVFRIVIPHNVLSVYKREAAYLNKLGGAAPEGVKKVTVAMLLSRAITDEAHAILKYDELSTRDLIESLRREEAAEKRNKA